MSGLMETPRPRKSFWEGKSPSFEEWFATHDWIHDEERRIQLKYWWDFLEERFDTGAVASAIDGIMAEQRAEYGE